MSDNLRPELDAILARSERHSHWPTVAELADMRADNKALVAEVAERDATIAASGDEHHTMDELYEYRMLYSAHAARGWLASGVPVVKSWRHSDGELCFGGGWFIVTATLPTGQVSNHYAAEHWDLFDVPDVWCPLEYDGHSPADAADRLRTALDTKETS